VAAPERGGLPQEVGSDRILESRCRHDIQVDMWGREGNKREQTENTSTLGNSMLLSSNFEQDG